MFTPKIIALDLDGTLFSGAGEVTPYTREQIRLAVRKKTTIVISTGRPFTGLPFDVAKELGIAYAITANGAAIYRIADKTCLYEDAIAPETAAEICNSLKKFHLHLSMATPIRKARRFISYAIPGYFRNRSKIIY